MSRYFILILFVLNFKNITPALSQNLKTDSIGFADFLKKGKFSGFSRTFLMSTINEGALKDFISLGTNIGGQYETPVWKGFQFRAGASFIFNLAGTDLTKPDSITLKPSRYEIGLYDLQQPGRRWDLGKLEEFYLRYYYKKSQITVGRQLPQMPFINPQDGRIRPTFVEGALLEINDLKNFQFKTAFLWRISPRSITGWYNIGESMSFYPEGRGLDGKPSGYINNTRSSGVFLANAIYQIYNEEKHFGLKIQLWEQLVLNVFNTVYFQTDWNKKIGNIEIGAGLQGIQQNAVAKGGNDMDSLRYFSLNQKSWTIGSQLFFRLAVPKKMLLGIELNYNRIFGSGRFLSPREWGREPLYTFLPRERLEGAGDVQAFSAVINFQNQKLGLITKLSYGHYLLPDVKKPELNKYAMPSFGHLQFFAEKKFTKLLKGLNLKFLYLYKLSASDTYNNPNFIYNKVNMHHFEMIIDFKF
jgi:hypothetical protein